MAKMRGKKKSRSFREWAREELLPTSNLGGGRRYPEPPLKWDDMLLPGLAVSAPYTALILWIAF
jgi:hypothetical protein